jgi:hypothetical protein
MPLLPALTALALAAATPATLPAPAPAPLELSAPSSRLKLLGLQLDGGVPDGGVVSLVVRPIKWVRADAGFAYNYFSMGARGGLTVVPFHWAIVPTLRVEAGRFFKSDVNDKVARFASDIPTYMKPALDGFGYDYASAQVGLEFGSQRSFVFFVRGGLAWLKADFGDGRNLRDDSSPDTELDVSGLSVTASGPTASLGFLFYVW